MGLGRCICCGGVLKRPSSRYCMRKKCRRAYLLAYVHGRFASDKAYYQCWLQRNRENYLKRRIISLEKLVVGGVL